MTFLWALSLMREVPLRKESIFLLFFSSLRCFLNFFICNLMLQDQKILLQIQQDIIEFNLNKLMKKAEQLKDKISGTEKIINTDILPKTAELVEHIKGFHNNEIREYENMIVQIDDVSDRFRDKLDECETYLNEIRTRKSKDSQFNEKGHGFLEAKNEQIKSKVKNIDAVSAGIKETVGKVKPEKLKKLPVLDERNLKKLFTVLYRTLYTENDEEFSWSTFKNKALKHEGGEDFIFRMVNINFKEISTEKYEQLMEIKGDPEFQHFCLNASYALDIIELVDWIEYVCLGHQFSLQKKKAEKQYEKIRKDLDKRSGGSLQMSEKFWQQASAQIDKYQNDLQTIGSDLRTIVFGLKKSIEECSELEQKRNEGVAEINGETAKRQ